ncbi:glycosyltransferase family 2 protein [uncultured Sphingomonas sp.]|uniref:glycosyltransferase family 2 protein n=1 Tax=uncultured Sphingomonas sp. TaxID=158754 RepID=UPI0026061755|nr:glycosyltransferase family 2 protein [uncultured Sphingomonas sp.]
MSMAPPSEPVPEVTVIVVSYNTRELTLRAVETLLANAGPVAMRVVVFDNASADGSAEAVAAAFPGIETIAHPENIGFARANNLVAQTVTTPWLCLLNPDTETHPHAIANLLAFAKARPQAGVTGGRTVFPDGSLNPASCWRRITPWSLFTQTTGLARAFPRSSLFNPEAMGGWRRDSVREVDIVVGCFLMISTALWRELGGFNRRYFMYGEDADLCLRARALGYRPMITPDAQIMHLVGASTRKRGDKIVAVMRAKATLVRDHWPAWLAPLGIAQLWLWGLARRIGAGLSRDPDERARLMQIWRNRRDWLAGY